MIATRYQFRLTGVTPVILHADDIDWADSLERWRKDPRNKNLSKPGDDRSPGFTWIGSLYSDGTQVAIPSENLAACMRSAGARVKLTGRKTLKEGSMSGIYLEQDHVPLLVNGKPVPMAPIDKLRDVTDYTEHLALAKKLGFELFAKRAKIGQSKHIRVRPKFTGWSLSGTLQVDAPEITGDLLGLLFSEAGKVGLGDWRPGCKTPGRFGMFEASVEKIK